MADLITTFYEPDKVPPKQALRPGAVFNAPILFVDSGLRLLKIEYVDPEHRKPPMLKLGKEDEDSFKHPPVLELGLRDNEELAALKCKSRPVIIFSQPLTRWKFLGEERQGDSFLWTNTSENSFYQFVPSNTRVPFIYPKMPHSGLRKVLLDLTERK